MKPSQKLILKVALRFEDAGNIVRLRLENIKGDTLPAFTAGAHIDIYLPNKDLWRQYSICSDPSELTHYEIGVLKDPNSRGGSVAIHELAVEGAQFKVEGPRNHFTLDETARKSVLLGGGIGITPMIAMARRLHFLSEPFEMHYCTRSQNVTAFYHTLKQASFASQVHFHFDDQAQEQKLDLTQDLPVPDARTHLYVCGPQGFMEWVIKTAEQAGHARSNIHREYFSSDTELTGDSFVVEARQSGVTLNIGPDDTIAKALVKAGIDVEVKCEEGVCGTCVTDVLEGDIDHRDQFLTNEEREDGDQICVCCSRANGKLVLDI